MMRAQRKGSAQELQECLKQAKTASISFFESAVMHARRQDFTALAVKYGTRYCAVDKPDCYGSFAQPCDFTDFRYGPTLAQFFPTCKTDDADAAAMPLRDEQRTRRD